MTEPYSVDVTHGTKGSHGFILRASLDRIDDLKTISWANQFCNAYGLDTISMGGHISFAMEC